MTRHKDPYPLSEPDQAIAAALAKKMMEAAGKERPEILAYAALLVIQLIAWVHDKKAAK